MGKRAVILGAGGFGRGVYGWLSTSPRHVASQAIEEIVFIDDQPRAPRLPSDVVSTVRDYKPHARDLVICALGNPSTRRRAVELCHAKGATMHTFVDDRAVLGPGVEIGTGSVICPGTVISAYAQLGDHVHANFNCSVGHDVSLGSYTTLSPSVNIMGEVRVGTNVFLGGGAIVLPRLDIGDAVTVGAGAVVTRDLHESITVVGNPARQIRGSK